MNRIDELLKEIKVEIESESYVQEYFRLRKLIESDDKLSKLDKEIKIHQKIMCENRNNKEVFDKENELYQKATLEFESNPIVKDYLIVKEEVLNLLNEMKGVLD